MTKREKKLVNSKVSKLIQRIILISRFNKIRSIVTVKFLIILDLRQTLYTLKQSAKQDLFLNQLKIIKNY